MPKLTKTLVKALPKGEYIVWDDEVPRFGVRVKPSGTKSYVIQYKHNGQGRRYTLGSDAVLSAEVARQMAKELLVEVAKGGDPAKRRRDDRDAPTVKVMTTDYIELHAKPHKRASSVQDDESMIRRFIVPKFGTRKVKDVSRRDVEGLLNGLRDRPCAANRVQALLSKMFNLAVGWGWRTDNPVHGIPKNAETKRDRWLQDDELARLLTILDGHENQRGADAIRLLLLTGARRNEVFKATWDQFDLDRGVWTKPAHFTKQKRIEHTPLSPQAWAFLREMKQRVAPDSSFVFPGDAEGMPLNDIKKFWTEVRKAAGIEDVRLHDLRHTFASHLVSAGVSLAKVGCLLGHTQAQTTMRYAHLADDPLRAAADAFGRKVEQLRNTKPEPTPPEPASGNVIQFPGARRSA